MSNFLDVTLKVQVTKAKVNKWDDIKLKPSMKKRKQSKKAEKERKKRKGSLHDGRKYFKTT